MMYPAHFWAVVLIVSGSTMATAADEVKPTRRALEGFRENAGPLIPADILPKLKLTADQQNQIERLNKEFAEKNQQALNQAREKATQLQEEARTAKQNQDRAALQGVRDKLYNLQQGIVQLRKDYEGKLAQVLNEEQRKALQEEQKNASPPAEAPPRKKGVEGAQPRKPDLRGLKDGSGALLPAEALARLKLDANQQSQVDQLSKEFANKVKEAAAKIKDQLAQLQQEAQTARQNQDKAALRQIRDKMETLQQGVGKLRDEFESKLRALLSEEQKKALDELKKDFPKQPGAAPARKKPANS